RQLRRVQDELAQLARDEPRELAALTDSAKCQTPVAIDAVPAQRGGVERLAAHGLHRIAEDRLDLANLDRLSQMRSSRACRGARRAPRGYRRLRARSDRPSASSARRARGASAAP